jgi:hypothetical protein
MNLLDRFFRWLHCEDDHLPDSYRKDPLLISCWCAEKEHKQRARLLGVIILSAMIVWPLCLVLGYLWGHQ